MFGLFLGLVKFKSITSFIFYYTAACSEAIMFLAIINLIMVAAITNKNQRIHYMYSLLVSIGIFIINCGICIVF